MLSVLQYFPFPRCSLASLNIVYNLYFVKQPLQQVEWYGNPRGYNISYREVGGSVINSKWRSVTIEDHTANSHILDSLEEFAKYEIITQAFNDVGTSAPSPIAVERTRESGMYIC